MPIASSHERSSRSHRRRLRRVRRAHRRAARGRAALDVDRCGALGAPCRGLRSRASRRREARSGTIRSRRRRRSAARCARAEGRRRR